MKSFKSFLNENKEIKWNSNPDIGWWEDNDKLTLYHGTHINNIESFLKNGINKTDPETNMISLALEPFTARAYANMSAGGEYEYGRSKKPKNVPMNERVVIKFEIPMSWIKKNMDPKLGGNTGMALPRMTNKELYDKWDKSDMEYYQLAEIRIKSKVPSKFIKGYMLSK